MKLPIGMLIYWAHRFDEDYALISGMWYYKEMYVPSSKEEKMNSLSDLKSRRCTGLKLTGTFSQIKDILSQADRFRFAGTYEISQFSKLVDGICNSPSDKAYFFDNISEIKGTSLSIDMSIEVNESMEVIRSEITNGKPVCVTITADWSLLNNLFKEPS